METDRTLLQAHVAALCPSPRPAESPALERAREYVTDVLRPAGWLVRRHSFQADSELGDRLHGSNLIVQHTEHPVSNQPRFCLGAHLDSRAETPGADDNASAVAALLEIAHTLPGTWPADAKLDLELVVFDLEEHGMLGGTEHARLTRAQGVELRGMVSLEMLGYCDHAPRSQALPRSLIGMYPDTGNFIAVIGNQNSHRLIDVFSRGMRRVAGLPVEMLAVPENGNLLQATRLSDHSPFWDAGYAALMITDTSFLRNPHYHLPSDTPGTLDFEFLHRVTEGCLQGVREALGVGL